MAPPQAAAAAVVQEGGGPESGEVGEPLQIPWAYRHGGVGDYRGAQRYPKGGVGSNIWGPNGLYPPCRAGSNSPEGRLTN